MTTTEKVTATAPDGGAFDLTVVLPDAPNGAGVVLYQEIFGVNDFILGKAADLAGLGYTVACPDVFWRVTRNMSLGHDDVSMGEAFETMMSYAALDAGQNVADLVAGLETFRALPAVTGRVASMGYCLGGWLSFELAAAADVDACVSYYGSGVPGRLELAGDITCPILFHFGNSDAFIPTAQAEQVRDAFAERDDVEFHLHDAGHAFENPDAPPVDGNAAAATSAWQLTVDFLDRTLLAD